VNSKNITMAGLDPATQPASVSERKEDLTRRRGDAEFFFFSATPRLRVNPFAPAYAVALGGRVKPGHGERGWV
jgi:hypothetical protein